MRGLASRWHLGLPVLNDLERETLRLGLDLGYFDLPRECTMGELADSLGLSKSGAHYRIKRLQAKGMRLLASMEPGVGPKKPDRTGYHQPIT